MFVLTRQQLMALGAASLLWVSWDQFVAAASSHRELAYQGLEVAAQIKVIGYVLCACAFTGWWQHGFGAIASYLGITIGKYLRGEKEQASLMVVPTLVLMAMLLCRKELRRNLL